MNFPAVLIKQEDSRKMPHASLYFLQFFAPLVVLLIYDFSLESFHVLTQLLHKNLGQSVCCRKQDGIKS